MGRQQRPEADASSRRGGSGEPSRQPRSGSPEPGSSATPAPGGQGAAEGKRRSPRPGAAEPFTHTAGGRRPPSPRAGARTQLAVFPGRNIHSQGDRSSFFAAAPKATESPGRTWEEEPGRRRRLPGRTGCAATSGARAPRGSRAGVRTQMHRPLLGRRGTQRLRPPRPGPPPAPAPAPAPARPADPERADPERARSAGTRRAGRGRAHPSVRGGPSPSLGVAFAAPPAPSLLLLSPHCDSSQRESGGGRRTEK